MALPDMNLWDPNVALEDIQLMAMASWLSHEEKRAIEIQKFMTKVLSEPLLITTELEDLSALIYAHQHLARNPQVLLDYVER